MVRWCLALNLTGILPRLASLIKEKFFFWEGPAIVGQESKRKMEIPRIFKQKLMIYLNIN